MRKQAEQDSSLLSFSGPNLGYMMEMYDLYLEDPSSVDEELQQYFKENGSPYKSGNQKAEVNIEGTDYSKVIAAVQLADSIRAYGHLAADINPLHDKKKDTERIELETYGLTKEDLEKIPVDILIENSTDEVTNGYEAIEYLKKMYTRTIAFEYAHVHDREEKKWLKNYIESGSLDASISDDKKKETLNRLVQVEGFENFVHKTFVGQKRFSIEGLDTMVPLLDEIIQSTVEKGARSINIGMAHRGRLNVLAHVLEKPYEMIFAEFQHSPSKDLIPSEGSIGITYGWTGDVKYHLGADRNLAKNEAKTRITLANNPSHLEVISPIVAGYTRAAQENRSEAGIPDIKTESSLAIMIHGDAAFPGQGVVAETLNMSQLRGYHTGGSIHVIANNMIGFTTESFDSRSTQYASDTAKGFEVPILHVNADDPEACLAAAIMASEYRATFSKDFVIDLIGYRRFGHNEMDEPMVTNPDMYTYIKNHDNVRKLYEDKLVGNKTLSAEEAQKMREDHMAHLQKAYDSVPKSDKERDISMEPPEDVTGSLHDFSTGVKLDRLTAMNQDLLSFPEGFNVFKKLEKILQRRQDPFEKDGKVDWAHAETLAFGAILQDGTPIRLSGQDSQRGTFAHRHLVLHDEKTGEEYTPLHHIKGANASFCVYNSPLTEAAVVGFEYGYNVFSKETLVLWEAQYGDFANMAQVMFDQFVSSSRAKWGQKSGLVMLLPHGYEGQGPEHSSARMERFLTLAAENNWTVANLTSSAQYFHILRRQAAILKKEEVRPLIIMTPKSLLRHPLVSRGVEEFTEGGFRPLIEHPELGKETDKVERIVLSSGKVGIDLLERAEKEDNNDWLHLVRIEEIYPFPMQEVREIFSRYPNLKEVVWVQEEPKNMGAWTFVEPRLLELAPEGVKVDYIGRRRRSSPAEGDPTVHKKEQERILEQSVVKGKE
ncbi:2-oxoglutarate dehydrogenase E1 component [Jeotgalibacillus sp. R-1-5s-1]|uniref:2-oxoglutarate dehydrogenase E1 component n=1 Tax=Jeotgalibacillus sp. R-1-5s-1 TaxID=2555897 RepID=UPI0010697F46|nr:2-oxoglutarate dehydrogenase E1 component [Jeotgalibacillus sp. R-1-5s-1]TFE03318.1 2-oxoglutarate dehydrogenase E1 component [Jeotgalibacillus sp. R-1-5s-1]